MKKQDHPFPPPRFVPTKCNLCEQCYLDTKTTRCIFGGPFTAYLVFRDDPPTGVPV